MLDFSAQIGSLLLKSYWVSFYTRVTYHHSVWCYESQEEDKKRESFPYENNCECYRKLASKSWPVLFTLIYFFYTHTLLFFWKIKSCHRCFPQQIIP